MSDTCRSCQAPIIWVTSATTKRPMPLDAKPEKRVVVDEHHVGRVVDAYVSHFSTCPNAAQHRKKPTPVEQASAQETKKP